MANSKQPGFFKTFWLHRSSQTLKIPLAYVEHIKVRTPKNVNLKGPCGETWPVKLVRRDERLYFEQGWSEFVKYHSLQDTNFCIFKYNGKSDFKVKIFDGKSGIKLLPSNQMLNESDSKHKTADSCTEDRRSFVQTMIYYNVNRSAILKVPSWFVKKHFSGNVRNMEIILENKEGRQWPVKILLETYVLSAGWMRFVKDNHLEEEDTCTFEFVGGLKLLVHISRKGGSSKPKQLKRQRSQQAPEVFGDKKKRRVSCSEDDIANPTCSRLTKQRHISQGVQKVAQVPSQHHAKQTRVADSDDAKDFPSFTVIMKEYKHGVQNLVRISSEFTSTYFSNYGVNEEIVLQNEKGEEWSANFIRQQTRALLSGWTSFVRDNQIKVNDECTFKLVGKLKMRVHISRHCAPLQEAERCEKEARPRPRKQRVREDKMAKKTGPAIAHVLELLEQQKQKTDEIMQLVSGQKRERDKIMQLGSDQKREIDKIMQMVKNLGTGSSP